MTVRDKVVQLIMENPKLRDNDNLLIAYYIRDVYGLQNTFDIALSDKISGNIYETIRRERQKIQQSNPFLKASEPVREYRSQRELETKERMKGV